MVKGVIFDLDGTLAYTAPDMLSALNESARLCGFEEITPERLSVSINFAPWEFVTGCLPPETPEERKREFFDNYCRLYSTKWRTATTPLYPGIYDLLCELKRLGIPAAVLTNKATDDARAIIEKAAPGLFVYVQGAEEGLPHKPELPMTELVLSKLGLTASEVLYVGDSDVDVATARVAGMPSAIVTWGYRTEEHLRSIGAERLVHTAEELLEAAVR